MAATTYALAFNGYWRATHIAGLPSASGIYGVYACTYNAQEGTVSIRKLVYIGEASSVHDRVAGHERWSDWQRHLVFGEELSFNAALIAPASDRRRAEAAMIHRHKPPCNVDFVHAFPYDQTTIFTSGKSALMDPYFTVCPAQPDSLVSLLGAMVRK